MGLISDRLPNGGAGTRRTPYSYSLSSWRRAPPSARKSAPPILFAVVMLVLIEIILVKLSWSRRRKHKRKCINCTTGRSIIVERSS